MPERRITVKLALLVKGVTSASITAGTTLEEYLKRRNRKYNSAVRVNSRPVGKAYVLKNGDYVTIIGKVSGG